MTGTGIITMSMREIDRVKIIQSVIDGNLKPWQAALRLMLTTRQVQRLANRYRADGAVGLISKKRGQPGHRQLVRGVAAQALAILRDQYPDCQVPQSLAFRGSNFFTGSKV